MHLIVAIVGERHASPPRSLFAVRYNVVERLSLVELKRVHAILGPGHVDDMRMSLINAVGLLGKRGKAIHFGWQGLQAGLDKAQVVSVEARRAGGRMGSQA